MSESGAFRIATSMHVLLLGGTSFVGRHIAEAFIAAGHAVTFFNRGVTNGEVFAGHPHVRGDRTVASDVARLAEIAADVVVDTCGYAPDDVRASAAAVAPFVKRYVFVSTIDAVDLSGATVDEESPMHPLPPGTQTAAKSGDLYGVHKAECERVVARILGDERVLVVRPGLVVGPYDPTDRFTYWPVRVARGGEVLAPRAPSLPVQIIDARDLASWVAGALARDLAGTFLLCGNPREIAIADVLETSRTVAASDARFTYVTDAFLEEQEVGAWVELPLWLPSTPDVRGLLDASNARARATGLTLRPLAETIADTLAEYRGRPPERTLRAGLSAEREAELLARWSRERDASA